jgi:hypothetical protein
MTGDYLIEYRVADVMDLSPIPAAKDSEEPLRFRIEVLEDLRKPGTFRARVLRYEMFRVQPTFPQKRGKPAWDPADTEMIIVDNTHDWHSVAGKTVEEVVDTVVRKLRESLNVK